MSVALNRVAAQKIEEFYHRKGRFFAQVHLAEGSKPEDAKVVFQITEGPVVKVSKVQHVKVVHILVALVFNCLVSLPPVFTAFPPPKKNHYSYL